MLSPRGSSQLRDRTEVSRIVSGFFTGWATRKVPTTTIANSLYCTVTMTGTIVCIWHELTHSIHTLTWLPCPQASLPWPSNIHLWKSNHVALKSLKITTFYLLLKKKKEILTPSIAYKSLHNLSPFSLSSFIFTTLAKNFILNTLCPFCGFFLDHLSFPSFLA